MIEKVCQQKTQFFVMFNVQDHLITKKTCKKIIPFDKKSVGFLLYFLGDSLTEGGIQRGSFLDWKGFTGEFMEDGGHLGFTVRFR